MFLFVRMQLLFFFDRKVQIIYFFTLFIIRLYVLSERIVVLFIIKFFKKKEKKIISIKYIQYTRYSLSCIDIQYISRENFIALTSCFPCSANNFLPNYQVYYDFGSTYFIIFLIAIVILSSCSKFASSSSQSRSGHVYCLASSDCHGGSAALARGVPSVPL